MFNISLALTSVFNCAFKSPTVSHVYLLYSGTRSSMVEGGVLILFFSHAANITIGAWPVVTVSLVSALLRSKIYSKVFHRLEILEC